MSGRCWTSGWRSLSNSKKKDFSSSSCSKARRRGFYGSAFFSSFARAGSSRLTQDLRRGSVSASSSYKSKGSSLSS